MRAGAPPDVHLGRELMAPRTDRTTRIPSVPGYYEPCSERVCVWQPKKCRQPRMQDGPQRRVSSRRQPRGKQVVSWVNSHSNATSRR